MKRLIIALIFTSLIFISCSSNKKVVSYVFNNKEVETYQQVFQRSKDKFLLSDSANAITQDLGWAKRIVTEAKISENTIPYVFKCVNDNCFTLELPCWEFDTPDYKSANVVVEHNRLDSALVKAKMQGIDEIYICNSDKCYDSSSTIKFEHSIDSIEYQDDYADYVRYARFSCICITKTKNKYIVNATIVIPRTTQTDNADSPSK